MKPTLVTEDPEVAAGIVRAGGVVAFPTETVYGLGADATSETAVSGIFAAKGRPSDNPLIVHVADEAQLSDVTNDVTPLAAALLERFAPGPLTVIVQRKQSLAPAVTAGLDTVGVRIPDLPLTRAFLRAAGRPIAAPSANRSGAPSPTRASHVLDELDGKIDAILVGPDCRIGLESTVVDARGASPIVLREGAVTFEALLDEFPDARIARGDDPIHRSPGTRHRHYAPKARVALIDATGGAAELDVVAVTPPSMNRPDLLGAPRASAAPLRRSWIGLDAPPHDGYVLVHVAGHVEAYAHALFDFLRRSDTAEVDEIHCQWPPAAGLGAALRDRLRRAARG